MATKLSWWQKVRADLQALLDESMFRSEGKPTRLYRFIHFWMLVGRSFVRNRCPIRASALSYATLLALIPMLAVALSVTSSLLKTKGEEQMSQLIDQFVSAVMVPTNAPAKPVKDVKSLLPLESDLAEASTTNEMAEASTNEAPSVAVTAGGTNAPATTAGSDALVAKAQKDAARLIHEFIQNTRSGTLGVTGMILLIVVAIRMLSSIEETFNDIWGVTRGRSWPVRIVLYWATLTLGPLLLAGAQGLAGSQHFAATRAAFSSMPFVGGFLFKLVPLFLLWLVFALFYKGVPNTKVNFSAAFVGGAVSGTLWHLNNVFGFLYVSRVVSNSKIYGSLGLVPVFMAGIYLSWFILLFGAQVAYAFQNRSLYLQEKLAENVNQRGREFVALRLMTSIGQRFQRGRPAPTVEDMSTELGIPSRLIQQVLHTLIAAHLVIEMAGTESSYTPARPLEHINAHHVLMAMRATPGMELETRDEPVREEVYGEFARIQEAEKQVASGISLLALVDRAQARLALTPPPSDTEEIKLKPALTPSTSSSNGPSGKKSDL